MSDRQEKKDIVIKDLPPEETLTPEEKERLAGAGRFRPALEALEARDMMSANPMAPVIPAGGGAAPNVAHVRTLGTPAPASTAERPAGGVLGASATPGAAAGPAATANAATRIFNDDFNQPLDSQPNDKTWYVDRNKQVDPNNNNVKYSNKKDNLAVVEDSGATDKRALALTINKVGVDSKGNPLFKSARITTQIDPVAGKLEYGRIEARIRLSSAKGSDPVWPAFWMLGSDINKVGWPNCGEIDILEYNGNARTTTGTLVTPDKQYRYYNQYKGPSLGDGQYHTFAIDWAPGSVKFSVDGNTYATVKMGNGEGKIPASQWTFNKPFYVILNVAAFPSQRADFTSQTMYVDYVRAYSSGIPAGAVSNNSALTSPGLTSAATGEAAPATSRVDLALGRPVVASSLENNSYRAANVVDGNSATRWSSQFSDPQWIYVDLGATYNITEVTLNWETAAGKNYLIQVSADATSWTTIETITGNTTAGVHDYTGLSGSGRYVRIYGTARATPYGYSLCDFNVYGTRAEGA